MSFDSEIKNLMVNRARVAASHGSTWPCRATHNYVRGTFGIGQLVAEAVDAAEQLAVSRSEARIGFELDGAISAIRASRPSRVRHALREWATIREIPEEMLDSIIFEIYDSGRAPINGTSISNVVGLDTLGRKVKQA